MSPVPDRRVYRVKHYPDGSIIAVPMRFLFPFEAKQEVRNG